MTDSRVIVKATELLAKSLPPEAMAFVRYYLRHQPQLVSCTVESLRDAFLAALALRADLAPERGEAYLIPFRNSGTGVQEARLVLGYRYYVRMGYDSGLVKLVRTGIVYEGDEYEVELGTEPRIVHQPRFQSRTPVLYYVDIVTANGHIVQVMGAQEAAELRRVRMEATRASSPWHSDEHFPAMIFKTLIRRAYKYLHLPALIAQAIFVDEQESIPENRQKQLYEQFPE